MRGRYRFLLRTWMGLCTRSRDQGCAFVEGERETPSPP